MSIGERVAYIRQQNHLSQEEFAQRINVSQSHIANVEKGRKPLTAKLCKLICLEFMVREEWLWNEKGSMSIVETRDLQHNQNVISAILVAKSLYEVIPDLYPSCESVHSFLQLFRNQSFCALFNRIARIYTLMPEEYTKFAALALEGFDVPITDKEYDHQLRSAASKKYADDPLAGFLNSFIFDDDWVKLSTDESDNPLSEEDTDKT